MEVVRPGELDVLVRDDEVLGRADHVVAHLVREPRQAGLVRTGDARLPRLHHRLEPDQMRHAECELHRILSRGPLRVRLYRVYPRPEPTP